VASDSLIRVTANILEKAVRGATASDIGEALAILRNASFAGEARDVERLTRLLVELANKIGDSGVAERGINLLIDTTHDLSSTLALQDLLRTIVTRARSLVGANLAWLTLLDEDRGVLRTVTAEGHLSPVTSAMSTRVGYGAVSLIVNSKSFFDTQDYLGDRRFRHSPALDRIFRAENIVSLAGFPIISQDKLQGILFIADRYFRKLTGREVSVLGSFALHAGVAMRNAQAFTMLSEALAEAERNRLTLVDYIRRSPMNFVKQVRLGHVRKMLCAPSPTTTVTSVAFACGFGNLGHLANDYRQVFGESPSATLNRSRGQSTR
jgi:AraC-like DNA-binding protein